MEKLKYEENVTICVGTDPKLFRVSYCILVDIYNNLIFNLLGYKIGVGMKDLENQNKDSQVIIRFFPILVIILCIFIFVSTIFICKTYSNQNKVYDDYVETNQAISNFKETSDYLTNQLQLFAIKNDKIYMDAYFYEVDIFKRRETFKNIILKNHKDDDVGKDFMLAYEESKKLNSEEFYIIRLICDGINLEDDFSKNIRNIELKKEDENLSALEKLLKAQDLVFSEEYVASKSNIMKYASFSHATCVNYFTVAKNKNDFQLRVLFSINSVLLILLVFIFLIFFRKNSLTSI